MIGLIVTGHANFASGITSSLKLISGGELEFYQCVDFKTDESVETLEEHLNQAMDSLKDCQGILVLADLVGGSPFKTSTILGIPRGNVEIVAGVNLPMLVELNLLRTFQDDIKVLAGQAVNTGRNMITRYVFEPYVEEEVDEGI